MNIKANLLITALILAVAFVTAMWWDARGERNSLQEYAEMFEAQYDSMQTEIIAGKEVAIINARRYEKDLDVLNKEIEARNVEIASLSRTTVVFDTIWAVGEADTIYTEGQETVYRLNEVTPNYTLLGLIKTPSGSYSVTVVQKPFGLEIREVTTPSGRKQVFATVVGRDDLKISNVDFYAEDVTTKKDKKWALGVGAIVAEGQVDWAISLRRDRLFAVGSVSSAVAGIELIRW